MADETTATDTEAGDAAEAPAPLKPLDLRVARILEASEHPNADRLLLLQVDLGSEQRQIVAGIAGKYEPDELPGKHIVIVANLKPAKLRGEVSEGMMLAAESDEGTLGLVLAPGAEAGTRVGGGQGGPQAQAGRQILSRLILGSFSGTGWRVRRPAW